MIEPEEWSDGDSRTRDGICDQCDRETKVQYLSDPFIREVYSEDEAKVSDWCYPCYSDRHDDV
jgi:hypothetical protein